MDSQMKLYKCEKCNRSYKQKGGLTRHIQYECNVIPKFQCDICKRRFTYRHALRLHIGLKHNIVNVNVK